MDCWSIFSKSRSFLFLFAGVGTSVPPVKHILSNLINLGGKTFWMRDHVFDTQNTCLIHFTQNHVLNLQNHVQNTCLIHFTQNHVLNLQNHVQNTCLLRKTTCWIPHTLTVEILVILIADRDWAEDFDQSVKLMGVSVDGESRNAEFDFVHRPER